MSNNLSKVFGLSPEIFSNEISIYQILLDLPDTLEHEKTYDCEFSFEAFLMDPNYMNKESDGSKDLLNNPYKVRVQYLEKKFEGVECIMREFLIIFLWTGGTVKNKALYGMCYDIFGVNGGL